LLATAFHPELTGDLRIHRLFVDQVRKELAGRDPAGGDPAGGDPAGGDPPHRATATEE
jgi:hypothetical protein